MRPFRSRTKLACRRGSVGAKLCLARVATAAANGRQPSDGGAAAGRELGRSGAGGPGLGQGAAGLGGSEGGGIGRRGRVAVAEGALGLAEVKLDLGVARECCARLREILPRLGGVAAQEEDPAVGVLELRHLAAAQPPGDGMGALEGSGIGPSRRQKAGEVVGEDRAAARAGVEGLVVGDRPGEVPARLAQARPQEEELAVRIAGGGDALVEGGVGPGEIALASEEAEERAVRLGQGGGLGDECPVAGLGVVGPAFDRVEAGEEEAGRQALRIGGERRLDGAAGLVRLAGGETGADEAGEGLAPGIGSGIAAGAPAPPKARASIIAAAAAGLPSPRRRAASRLAAIATATGSACSRRIPATCPARAQSLRARWMRPSMSRSSRLPGSRRSASVTTPSAGPGRSSCIRKLA